MSDSTQELLADFIVSLDGYAAGDGWPGWWGLEGPEYLTWLEEQPESQYPLVMGANTYRVLSEMSGSAADSQSDFSSDETETFTGLDAIEKTVFSTTLREPLAWPNTELIQTDAVAAMGELKRTRNKPMRTIGSLSMVRSLMAAGLVDRLRLVVFPVITGVTGRERIYDGYADFMLEMVASHTFDGRLQLLEYIPTPLATTG